MRDPAVGQFGRRKLQESALGAADPSVLDLLAKNFIEGDAELILQHLRHMILSDEEAHSISFSVRDICEENPLPSLAGLAEWTYMHTPCSVCRRHAVERLLELSSLSSAFAEECAFDADRTVQALACTS